MAHYKVEICGINTSKLPLLSNEEKKTLFDKIKKGDKKARETYIHGNLRLVLSIIQRFNNSTENVDDLFQIGCIGLMKAIDNFDVTQNVKFSTYAVPIIMGEIKRYFRDDGTKMELSDFFVWLVDNYGDNEKVLQSFSSNFGTYSYTGIGSMKGYYVNRQNMFKPLFSHTNPKVAAWAENMYKMEEQEVNYHQLLDDYRDMTNG